MAEVALEPQAGVPGPDQVAGRSPWALAFSRLRRNRIALAAFVLFLLIVLLSFAAPLYGGRNSLEIGVGSAVIACLIATVLALIAGFYGGLVDALLSRLMDVIWAFPVYLLAICIATVLLTAPNGLQVGPIHVVAASLWLPTLIIGFVYVPYVYRPVRGHVLSVTEKEFVEAAVAQGASNRRLIFSEVLPNVVSVVIVLLPLMIATTILTEAALSFLGIGVQPPNASWGTIIEDGQNL